MKSLKMSHNTGHFYRQVRFAVKFVDNIFTTFTTHLKENY